jgi:hypothetical protein
MTRRIVAAIAWLVIAAMNASWIWAVVGGGFLDAMFRPTTIAVWIRKPVPNTPAH